MFNTSLIAKGAGVLVVGGGIIGAGTAYALNSGTNEPQKTTTKIKKRLANEKKKLLVSDDTTVWDIKLSTYERLKKTDTTFELTPKTNVGLKAWCATNVEQEDNETNQKLYERVKKVCTVPSNKEKLLKDTKDLATAPSDWAARTSAYKLENTETPIKGISKTTIQTNDLENWCNKELDKEFIKTNNKEALYVKWCTKTGT